MIERLIPIFAVVGIISSIGYLSLLGWGIYSQWGRFINLFSASGNVKPIKKKRFKANVTHSADAAVRS